MPRTKGSKNKPKNVSLDAIDIDARIKQTEEEIERLKDSLKDRKELLRILKLEKTEQDKQKIVDSILSTGKTPEQILSAIESPAFEQFLIENIKTKEEDSDEDSGSGQVEESETEELKESAKPEEGIEADIIE